jgi:hypothetical protein
MERCNPSEGLAKFVRSHDVMMHHRNPTVFENPDDPHTPLKEYIAPEIRDPNWKYYTDEQKRIALATEKFNTTRFPIWQDITGFFEKRMETGIPPCMRKDGAVKLIGIVHGLVKAQLRIDKEMDPENKVERAIFWDPLPEIMFHLGIAKSKMNSYLREFSGMSGHELADRVRIHEVKTKLRDDFRKHARAWHASLKEGTFAELTPRESKFELLKHIRAERRAEGIDRTALAASFRIPTFARLHRACLLHHGLTFLQIELAVIDEVLRELREAHNPQLVQKNTENGNASVEPQSRGGAENSEDEQPEIPIKEAEADPKE